MNYRIKELLRDRNLNISELAEKINVQRESLSRIVNGASTSADTLQRIASALNVHISELFEKDDSELIALIEQNGVYYKAETLDELNDIVEKLYQDDDYKTEEQKKKDAQIRLQVEKDKQLGKTSKFITNTMCHYDITISTVEELEAALSDPYNIKDRSKIVWIFNKKEKSIEAHTELRKSLNISSNK